MIRMYEGPLPLSVREHAREKNSNAD